MRELQVRPSYPNRRTVTTRHVAVR